MPSSESEEYIPERKVEKAAVRKRQEKPTKRALLKQHYFDRVKGLDRAAHELHESVAGSAAESDEKSAADRTIEGSTDTQKDRVTQTEGAIGRNQGSVVDCPQHMESPSSGEELKFSGRTD